MLITADIGIRPKDSLEQVARVVSVALSVALERETTGRYEEYPAFCANVLGLHIALLGIPDAATDMGTEASKDYELQVIPEGASTNPEVDISAFLVEVLRKKAGLECWVLD